MAKRKGKSDSVSGMVGVSEAATGEEIPAPSGPYLAAALIAERVLAERDNVASFVRVVDKITLHPAVSQGLKGAIPFDLTLYVAFRAGGRSAKSVLTLVQVGPLETSEPVGVAELPFDGTAAGTCDIRIPLVLHWEGLGQYWFDVYLDNNLRTRIPFEIVPGKLEERAE